MQFDCPLDRELDTSALVAALLARHSERALARAEWGVRQVAAFYRPGDSHGRGSADRIVAVQDPRGSEQRARKLRTNA